MKIDKNELYIVSIEKDKLINNSWKIFVFVYQQLEFLKFAQENGKILLI
jgi:hypothetical protein